MNPGWASRIGILCMTQQSVDWLCVVSWSLLLWCSVPNWMLVVHSTRCWYGHCQPLMKLVIWLLNPDTLCYHLVEKNHGLVMSFFICMPCYLPLGTKKVWERAIPLGELMVLRTDWTDPNKIHLIWIDWISQKSKILLNALKFLFWIFNAFWVILASAYGIGVSCYWNI